MIQYYKRLFKPATQHMMEKTTRGTEYLVKEGYIKQHARGIYNLLPLSHRILTKMEGIIIEELNRVGAQQMRLPFVQHGDIWKKSGRWEEYDQELLRFQDRKGSDYCLAPTHEEMITSLVSQSNMKGNSFPLLVYQVGIKYRDEMRPRYGLLRAREFLMKDMYSFDRSEEAAKETYQQIVQVYRKIFKRMGVKVTLAQAAVGDMGGIFSHELHVLSEVGEDDILICSQCNQSKNIEIGESPFTECYLCGGEETVVQCKGMEVGHTYLLGDRYSQPFKLLDPVERTPIVMGCYGIGITRLMGAIVESQLDDEGMAWPILISPYDILMVSLSPEYLPRCVERSEEMMKQNWTRKDILIDDREGLHPGKRLKDGRRMGIPVMVVYGRDYKAEGVVEIHERLSGKVQRVKEEKLLDWLTLHDQLEGGRDPKLKVSRSIG